MTAPRAFLAGAAAADITPPLSVPYLGFEPRHAPFRSVQDPLRLHAAWISDTERSVVLVTADLIGFASTLFGPGRDFVGEARSRIAAAAGVPAEVVWLAAAHVHSTPDTLDFRPLRESPEAVGWLETVIDAAALAAREAREAAFEAELRIRKTRLTGYSKNRRGESCLDEDVSILEFRSPGADGRRIVFVHYACHPVILQVQDSVSGDYVGVVERSVEKLEGVESCLFLQGACGDINPTADDSRDFGDALDMGEALAGQVETALAAPEEPTPVLVRAAAVDIELPSRKLLSPEARSAIHDEIRVLGGSGTDPVRLADLGRLYDEIRCRVAEGENAYRADLLAIRIGDAVLMGFPGEPFCLWGQALKSAAVPLAGLPCGYVNGYLGYLVPPVSWDRGGYETLCGPWSKLGPEAHDLVLAAFKKLLAGLRGRS